MTGSEQEVEIIEFLAPHVFFVTTELNDYRRSLILKQLSLSIKKKHNVITNNCFGNNEIVAVLYNDEFARAQVLDKFNEKFNSFLYYCWLIDHGIVIKTGNLYSIPKEIRDIAPVCQIATLNNICYFREQLVLGATGTIEKVSTVIPSATVVQRCLELISDNDKIHFKIEDVGSNPLMGDLIIFKKGKTISLRDKLCTEGLLTINEKFFENIKFSVLDYMKTHNRDLGKGFKTFKRKTDYMSDCDSLASKSAISDLEEFDVENTTHLENGRRSRSLNKSSTDSSVTDMSCAENTGKPKNTSTPKKMSAWEKAKELKARKSIQPKDNGEDSSRLTLEISSSENHQNISRKTSKDTFQSPFASITSVQSNRTGPSTFLPAGMENSFRFTKKDKKSSRCKTPIAFSNASGSVKTKHFNQKKYKTSTDDDCPTIQIPTQSDDTASESQPMKTENSRQQDDSSSSETVPIYTKQDFCRDFDGCTCVQCRIVLEDDDWDAPIRFDISNDQAAKSKLKGMVIKPPKLLKPSENGDEDNKIDILSVGYNGMNSMEKKLCSKVLVHGESIPSPIRYVSKVNIHPEIHNNLSKLNYKESKRIQHYAFPSITRNQNVFLVNEKKTGKTMAYLPIVTSFVMEKEERYTSLLKMGGGPLVIILCSNSKKCEEVHLLSKMILDKYQRKCSLVTYPRYGNISNLDILITMPLILSTLLSKRAVNFKRLCHLVLEDADVMLKSHNDVIMKFLAYGDQVLEHRNCPKSIQLIMCAQHWTTEMENVLVKLNKVPLVCIADYLEASLYGKTKLTIKFLETGCKPQSVFSILKDSYKFTKSVIICDAKELEEVQVFLTLKGIDCTCFAIANTEEDNLYLEAVWNNSPPGKYSVLLCTDDVFNILTVTSASILIHYCLPHSWSQFKRRFSCLLENVPSPFNRNQKKMTVSSFVFIDENCEPNMSKFSNFLKVSGIETQLPDKVKTFFQAISTQDEKNKITQRIEICPTVKILGKCELLNCDKRHIVNDQLDANVHDLPQNGSIKFKIIKMTGAASCSIKLLENFDLDGCSVRKFENQRITIEDLPYTFASGPKMGHLYLIKEEEKYSRCKLVETGEQLLVYLIDEGIYRKVSRKNLLKMPESLKLIPPQSFEIYLANICPPSDDTAYCKLAHSKSQFLIDSNCPNAVMAGTVVLQLGDNLWIDDVYECREMFDKSLPSIGFQLTRALVDQGIAVKNTEVIKNLYKLCEEANIQLPTYKIKKPSTRRITEEEIQMQPSWAFLDPSVIHEVIFTNAFTPHEFYVRQNKFSKQLQLLEDDIQKAIRKPFYRTLKQYEVGKCCLVKDKVNGQYARGLILSVTNNIAEILCVDYGDIVEEECDSLKHISNELIGKLPFQSIQCSLHGVRPVDSEWSDASIDLLYTMAFEEGTNDLKPLFVKVVDKQPNELVQRQFSYLVMFKDSAGRQMLINQLLVDCGFALPNGEELQDFDLPKVLFESDDEIEELPRLNGEVILEEEGNIDESIEDFDCEILDMANFLQALDLPFREITKPNDKDEERILPQIKAAPKVDYLTPELYWSQTLDALKLNIKVSDVNSAKIFVKHNRQFSFSTEKNSQKYQLQLLLFAKIHSTLQYTILGPQVSVTIKKQKAEEWPRLLYQQERVRKIYYDFASVKVKDEDTQKLPLQLNIVDSSSDEEENQTPYFVCSDLDSADDFDIPNDED